MCLGPVPAGLHKFTVAWMGDDPPSLFLRLDEIARHVRHQIVPFITCAPWRGLRSDAALLYLIRPGQGCSFRLCAL
jgi:hypothetical protein